MTSSLRGRRILFFANVDWSFLSHREEIAQACVAEGADVTLLAGDTGRIHEIERSGVRAVPLRMSRTGTSATEEAKVLADVAQTLRRLEPEVQHNASIKPVLYGSLAAQVAQPRVLVNAVSGAGSIFDKEGLAGRLRDTGCLGLSPILRRRNVHWVFQNEDDLAIYRSRRLVRGDQHILTMGSGVDLERFAPSPVPMAPVALFASRLIWSKGVGVFAEAAELVREKFPDARFVVAGDPEDANADSIGQAQLDQWVDDGLVEWAGIVDDMPALLSTAAVVCLPSWYREGVPKVLLEAAACQRPVIAGDIPGARRAVRDGETGHLINPQNVRELADRIIELFADHQAAAEMGDAARQLAVSQFGVSTVVDQTLDLYARALCS